MADEPVNNPAETFQKLLDRKNNDAMALASQLFDENYTLRTTVRELTGKQPAEGAMVLSPDNVKKWKAYEELGIEPKEIKKSLERLPDLEKQNKQLSQTENLFKLSDLGIDGSKLDRDVLREQLFEKYPDAVLSFKTEADKDGNSKEVAYIKPTAEGTESSFNEFANQSLAKYLPSLKVSAEAAPVKPGTPQDPAPVGGPASFFDRFRTNLEADRKATVVPAANIDERFGRPAQAA
jgi:hypothetical protein